ncbi:baseplate J/gp47 family protein [Dyella japonica]|uniref:Phage protein gp47/JayE n=1 Tax=Dyella japonica TaxID=231455 RepID=A0ABV2K0G9_9GAMM
MITTTAPIISSTGISAPSYADVLAYLQSQFQSIYGADIYLDPDSQDGQFLGIVASAINDANAVAIQIYQSMSPATSQGAALSNNVKLNGIARAVSSFSTVDVLITGQAGVTITNGIVQDSNGNQWALPPSVVIPAAGQITVTATSSVIGAIDAPAGSVTVIKTPTLGWQSVTNPSDATPGEPVESDADLRYRQTVSTAIPSLTVLDGIVGSVASITGVDRLRAYENDTNATDSNGIPSHSISMVIDGGDATAIANAIATKKTPGAGTYGTTSVSVTDIYGRPITIRFFRPTAQPITVAISLKALAGYSTTIGQAVQQAVSDYVNGVDIGGGSSGTVEWADAITAANSVPNSNTFKLTALTLTGPGGAGVPDVPLAFNQVSTCTPSAVTLTVS